MVNGVYLLPKTALWDTGSVIAELAYSRLQKITANEAMFRGEGYAGCVKSGTGSGGVPAAPGDRTDYGIKGSAPTGGGGFEKLLSWSVGAKMTYDQKHEFSLRYSDLSVPTKYNAAGTSVIGGGALGSSVGATDRGWLVFTYKTSF